MSLEIWRAQSIFNLFDLQAEKLIEAMAALEPALLALLDRNYDIMTVCTILGLPVAGSQILIFAMFGVQRAQQQVMERSQRRSFYRILLTWILTFPIGIGVCAGIYGILTLF